MPKKMKRCGLLLLAMMPIASVAFAAKAALSIAQLGKKGVTDIELYSCSYDSK